MKVSARNFFLLVLYLVSGYFINTKTIIITGSDPSLFILSENILYQVNVLSPWHLRQSDDFNHLEFSILNIKYLEDMIMTLIISYL